jgi:acetyl-CoA/propionyl-CoA carboxylase carboxyl transferase subunit
MGSKALGGDTVYATSDASISIMKPESAVAFLWNNRITEALTRADLVAEWNETCAAPETAAADGSIDDVIAPTELRSRVCSAVYMLLMKSDGTPDRKHCNLPL